MQHYLNKTNCLKDLYRVSAYDITAIQQFLLLKVPFVISGISNDWPAHTLWNLEYFEQIAGQSIVHCVHLDNQKTTAYEKLEKIFFLDLINSLKCHSGKNPPKHVKQLYMVISRISAHYNGPKVQLPQLLKDICIPGFMPLKRLWTVNLWLNAGNTRSNLHFDPDNNLLVPIKGSKELVLIHPKYSKFLYRKNKKNENTLQSNVNVFDSDQTPWPKAQKVFYHQTHIREGEALYLPSGWWHAVGSSKSLNIALNFWWLDSAISLINLRNPALSIQWGVKKKWFSILFPSVRSKYFSTSESTVKSQKN